MIKNVKNWQRFILPARVFHALGLFLLRLPMGQLLALFIKALASAFAPSRNFKTDSKNIVSQIFFTGIELLPILFVVATLFGSIVIIEVISLMGKVGFSNVVGSLIVVVIIRELGPIFTAFLIAGRSGSALTTNIGSMVINSEVDALATMGIDPVRYLVMPALIGGCFAVFIMNIFFSLSAICMGFIATKGAILLSGNMINIQLTWSYLSNEILNAITLTDFVFIIIKPIVFGAIIMTNACYQGLNMSLDIRQLPKATSRSVIRSFLYIILADVILSLYYFVDYINSLSNII